MLIVAYLRTFGVLGPVLVIFFLNYTREMIRRNHRLTVQKHRLILKELTLWQTHDVPMCFVAL